MLTPKDKVTSRVNDIMQVIVTRICDESCSNCTQLLPFRQDVKHMSLNAFHDAVRSMAGWPGVVALFGGNPCAHPNFDDLCAILEQEIPEQRRRGLWTNNLLNDEKGRVAHKTFWPDGRMNLNAHCDQRAAELFDKWLPGKIIESSRTRHSWHSPILMNYADYGLAEEDWITARESCDINQRWSGAIAERDGKAYGYFCEVAASLDGIRGVNNGVLAVPGWWRMPMQYFHEQVVRCCDMGCGVPLKRKGSLDCDELYDISASWADRADNSKIAVQMHYSLPAGTEITTDYQALRSVK
jgi:organic radical activating enzyme